MNLGLRIRNRRKELGMSVDELCRRIGKNRTTVYRYEKGDIENLPFDSIEQLAKALNTTPQYLMGWEAKEQKSKLSVTDGERTLGDVIKSLRINNNMSLVECSAELGISVDDLQGYENGSKQLSANAINEIARLFGMESVDVAELFLFAESEIDKYQFSKEYIEQVKAWNREFGCVALTEEERGRLFDFAKYLIWKRKQ